ncbi:Haloacid dehalogenase-like hydrolase superfamily protein isoform 2 [Hibiscus syriacus]|uniref:Haloacid dehalogenase-like hydrolase superfamily protein isoform 2 n=1 Tax=Hibiscus syriacus TaxID=106335 RepID=A0A6A3D5J6_HIBSY|nr:probable trehalose-phosphate phosphatase I [Hibiscus syriacus]KAE8735824.1 Haloacid dehalogenase-like hydrolase superfamily protein isoform 2 [Hibiscus syriacus]
MTNQKNVVVLDVISRGVRNVLPPPHLLVPESFSSQDLKILLMKKLETEKGGAKINAWLDSMRVSSPTRIRSASFPETNDRSSWIVHHPSTLSMFEQIVAVSRGKQIVMFLDYDDTTSPIFEDPNRTLIHPRMVKAPGNILKFLGVTLDKCENFIDSLVNILIN